MLYKSAFLALLCLLCTFAAAAQAQSAKSAEHSAAANKMDTLQLGAESSIAFFRQAGASPDTAKAMLKVRVFEKGTREVVQGATVLLHREQDKMLGRVTKHDGRCTFSPAPANYSLRIQMTGLKTLERSGIELEAGKVYELEVGMARQ